MNVWHLRLIKTHVYQYSTSQPVSRTWLQTARGSRPAHDGRYRADCSSHPGVADAEPLERCVATRVEEDVEGAQEAREGVHHQREQSDAGNAAGQSEGHCVERTERRETQRGEDMNIS